MRQQLLGKLTKFCYRDNVCILELSWRRSSFFLAKCVFFSFKSSFDWSNNLANYSLLTVRPFEDNRCRLTACISENCRHDFGGWPTQLDLLQRRFGPRNSVSAAALFPKWCDEIKFQTRLWNGTKSRLDCNGTTSGPTSKLTNCLFVCGRLWTAFTHPSC